jgi:membrane protein DedA with SNARE-associated domain
MPERLEAFLERMLGLPEPALHVVLGLMAALENIVPPLPADLVIVFGGFLAGQGTVSVWLVFFSVWLGNVGGALLVYALGRVYGAAFFAGPFGGFLLRPRQLAALGGLYQRYGFGVIFVSRFLPVFRSVVPVFAGLSNIGVFRTAVPIAAASGIWYGFLVYAAATAGQNWEEIMAVVDRAGRWLYVGLAIAILVTAYWWWHSRHGPEES